MNLLMNEISTQKTARYATIGDMGSKVTEILMVLHGYGQIADRFIQKFECILKPGRIVIAAEGMHRFYLEGTSGKVGASWMTRVDREKDIKDNMTYLEGLFDELMRLYRPNSIQLLGFSQGGATACRFIAHTNHKINQLWLWSSMVPPDLDYKEFNSKFVPTTVLYGNEDRFASVASYQKEINEFKEKINPFKVIAFEGGHQILKSTLKDMFEMD
jgi:predicted esterase